MFVSLPKVFDAMGPGGHGGRCAVLHLRNFCDADLLHFGFGVYRCELYGNLPHGQKMKTTFVLALISSRLPR